MYFDKKIKNKEENRMERETKKVNWAKVVVGGIIIFALTFCVFCLYYIDRSNNATNIMKKAEEWSEVFSSQPSQVQMKKKIKRGDLLPVPLANGNRQITPYNKNGVKLESCYLRKMSTDTLRDRVVVMGLVAKNKYLLQYKADFANPLDLPFHKYRCSDGIYFIATKKDLLEAWRKHQVFEGWKKEWEKKEKIKKMEAAAEAANVKKLLNASTK